MSDDNTQPVPAAPRTWGPFSGRQLVTMFVALVIVIGFPIGASAVTSNPVYVTDVHSGAHAAVDAKGNLHTISGGGSVAVSGTVTANAPTTSLYQAGPFAPGECEGAGETCLKLGVPPAGKALIITSIHISTWKNDAPGTDARLDLYTSLNATCDNFAAHRKPIEFWHAGSLGESVLTYPTGLAVGAGKVLCAENDDPVNLSFNISAFGYSVAANAVPADS